MVQFDRLWSKISAYVLCLFIFLENASCPKAMMPGPHNPVESPPGQLIEPPAVITSGVAHIL